MLPALTHLPKEHFSITLGWMNGTEEAIGQPSFNESRRRSLSAKRGDDNTNKQHSSSRSFAHSATRKTGIKCKIVVSCYPTYAS